MKILAIGAHPDDVEIGCGGALLYFQKYHQATITLLLMTAGEAGFAQAVNRTQEQEDACQVMGIEKCFWGNCVDTALHLQDAINIIENVVGEVDPDFVFTHYGEDTHQDHRVLADATVSACRGRTNLLHYESISSQNFSPLMFVDIEEFVELKCKAIASHISQEEQLGLADYVRTLAQYRAYRTTLKHVEGFIPRKFVWR